MPGMQQTLDRRREIEGASHPDWRPECRFVPLRAEDLATLLAGEAEQFGEDAEDLQRVFDAIRDVLEQETATLERDLQQCYARFNPDRETIRLEEGDPDAQAVDTLRRRLGYLLDKANFERLDDVRIAQVVERANEGRIQVRIHADRIDFLELWVRGHGQAGMRKRTFRSPIKGVEVTRPVFRRMAVVARLKDDPCVIIKLFKDIPEAEVEALLPHAEAAMTWLDRVKLFGASAGVVGAMALKLAKIAAVFAVLGQVLWIVLVGVGTIALRTFFGYKNAKTSRDWRRTQRLYFQNLGNNASALQMLIASVKQEELKEAYLAYALSLGNAGEPWSMNGLRGRVERYLLQKHDVEVDFDIEDAVETISRLGLWAPSGRPSVLPCQKAVERLGRYPSPLKLSQPS